MNVALCNTLHHFLCFINAVKSDFLGHFISMCCRPYLRLCKISASTSVGQYYKDLVMIFISLQASNGPISLNLRISGTDQRKPSSRYMIYGNTVKYLATCNIYLHFSAMVAPYSGPFQKYRKLWSSSNIIIIIIL